MGKLVPPEIIHVQRLSPEAESPHKEYFSLYDITLVARKDGRIEDDMGEINYFETDLIVTPANKNIFLEIQSHSQILPMGYIMLQPMFIFHGDTQRLVIPLYKFKEGPDLELPLVGSQIHIRSHVKTTLIHKQFKEIVNNETPVSSGNTNNSKTKYKKTTTKGNYFF